MKDNWQTKIDEDIVKVSLKVRSDSDFKCAFCKHNATQIHHLTPERYSGKTVKDNLLPICQNCHNLLERCISIVEIESLTLHEQEISECERVWVAKYRQAKEEINQLRNENKQEIKAFAEDICEYLRGSDGLIYPIDVKRILSERWGK